MSDGKTKESQYQVNIEFVREQGFQRLGYATSESWHKDPKHLVFTLARYKFVAKMLSGRAHVLEVGCGDAFGTRIVQAEVGKLTATDFDPLFIEDARKRMDPKWQFDTRVHDLLEGPFPGKFDALYSLDVLEHIESAKERRFLENAFAPLGPHSVAIIGTPSLESQAYASPQSKVGHINCKSAPDLKKLMEEYFYNVFLFSMNDEIVHTGHHKMAHYLFALGVGRRAK